MRACVCVYHLNRCKTSYWFSLICRGAVNLIPSTAQRRRWFEIVISGLIIPTYLRLYFSDIARGQAKNPNHNIIQFAALLSQSGINFEIYMLQNLPQIFAETISPTALCFWPIFAEILSPTNHGLLCETIAETLFWISTCWLKLYGTWLWLRLTISDALQRFRAVPQVALLFF